MTNDVQQDRAGQNAAIRKARSCYVCICGKHDVAYLKISKRQASNLLSQNSDIGLHVVECHGSIYIDREQ